jgi:uncharacterized protein YndB with AHSA1/START domain
MSHHDDIGLTTTTPSDIELEWTRRFNAPARLVFDTWTKPALLQRWFAPDGWSLPVCDADLRPGGSYRYVMRRDSGMTTVLQGVYREFERPVRFACTQVWEGFSEVGWRPEDEALMTVDLIEQDGTTLWQARLRYQTQQARDAVLAMPMTYERIDALLAELQQEAVR